MAKSDLSASARSTSVSFIVDVCAGCSREISDDDRFCSQCGLPVSGTGSSVDVSGGALGFADDDLRADVLVHSSSAVRSPRSAGRPRTALRVLGVLAVVGIFVVLFRGSPDQDSATSDGSTSPTTATAADTVQSSTTRAEPDTAVTESSTSVLEEEVGRGDGLMDNVDVAGLETLSDSYLITATARDFMRVDLASGEVVEFDAPGQIIGYFDGTLIALEEGVGLWAVAPGNPEDWQMALEIPPPDTEERAELASILMSDAGIVELDYYVFDGARVRQFSSQADLARSEAVTSERNPYSFSRFGLLSLAGGAIFEFAAGESRYLTHGGVRAAGARYMLVETCEAPDDCRTFWFDRRSKIEVDRPIPEVESYFGLVIDDGGRVLTIPEQIERKQYFDVARGEMLPDEFSSAVRAQQSSVSSESVSPDGRFLVAPGEHGAVLLYDLDEQRTHTLDFGSGSGRHKALIVLKES